MLLTELVLTSQAVAATPRRSVKIAEIAGLLRTASPPEVPVVVAFLSGELRQRQIGVGYAALGGLAAGGGAAGRPPPTLTVSEVDGVFAQVGAVTGAGAQATRRRMLAELFGRATDAERDFLIRLIAGELHQGALEGVMIEAVARAAGVPASEVRRAHLLGGSLQAVAAAALTAAKLAAPTAAPTDPADPAAATPAPAVPAAAGPAAATPDPAIPDAAGSAASAALRSFGLQVGRPLRPMLASSASSVAAAFARVSPAAVEWKIDGIRIQVHRDESGVAIFTRTLDNITARVPEIVEEALAFDVRAAVLDAEAVALYPDGRPRPFQVTASRAGTQADVARQRADVPLTAFYFDLLHLDGTDLIDEPASDRYALLTRVLPAKLLIPRLMTSDVAAAEAFFADAVARGHEGVVVKSPSALYAAGRRGSEWIKVKPRHTLDLVVLAAEWGHGRRRGWLSNLHLGARDPVTGGLVMLGKTFKGLTDEMLDWQTTRLLELAEDPDRRPAGDLRDAYGVLRVRPELVVEVAFDGVQASPRYPGGLALRFARVLRYRPDKAAAEADTIDAVRALWAEEPPGAPGPG
ncbi:MAG TPA: ATP-dependent DNA ligase [Streptosporangiaceae bacterium]|nr:ATP-dependent DNA ligase [Streptosporangiaceae bacterium]